MLETARTMPTGVIPLYFIQACSTCSFAILYASLGLYITNQLGLSTSLSNGVVGLFLAFNYILQLLGGLIGGRYLSNRALFCITIFIQSVGLYFLALAHPSYLYFGLSFFLVGCGLNTTCYNALLTQRFLPNDERRANAFFMSYGSMNIGFCVGNISSGFFDFSSEYQYLFYACMITNALTLLLISKYWAHFIDHNLPLTQVKNHKMALYRKALGLIITLLLIPSMFLCFHSAQFSSGIVVALSLVMFSVILILGLRQKSKTDKQKIMAYLILALSTILFWVIYFTGPMGITLFIKNNVDKSLGGFELATQWIKNINPMVIVGGAPLMVMLTNRLKARGYSLSVTNQFVCAFVLLALSFFFLSCGIIFANGEGYAPLFWVVLHIIAQGLSELLITPVGYAMIGRIAPPHLQGVLMGAWMLVTGVAASISPYFSNAMTKTESLNPLLTNSDFLDVFKQLGLWSLGGAIGLYFISRTIKSKNWLGDTQGAYLAQSN